MQTRFMMLERQKRQQKIDSLIAIELGRVNSRSLAIDAEIEEEKEKIAEVTRKTHALLSHTSTLIFGITQLLHRVIDILSTIPWLSLIALIFKSLFAAVNSL